MRSRLLISLLLFLFIVNEMEWQYLIYFERKILLQYFDLIRFYKLGLSPLMSSYVSLSSMREEGEEGAFLHLTMNSLSIFWDHVKDGELVLASLFHFIMVPHCFVSFFLLSHSRACDLLRPYITSTNVLHAETCSLHLTYVMKLPDLVLSF